MDKATLPTMECEVLTPVRRKSHPYVYLDAPASLESLIQQSWKDALGPFPNEIDGFAIIGILNQGDQAASDDSLRALPEENNDDDKADANAPESNHERCHSVLTDSPASNKAKGQDFTESESNTPPSSITTESPFSAVSSPIHAHSAIWPLHAFSNVDIPQATSHGSDLRTPKRRKTVNMESRSPLSPNSPENMPTTPTSRPTRKYRIPNSPLRNVMTPGDARLSGQPSFGQAAALPSASSSNGSPGYGQASSPQSPSDHRPSYRHVEFYRPSNSYYPTAYAGTFNIPLRGGITNSLSPPAYPWNLRQQNNGAPSASPAGGMNHTDHSPAYPAMQSQAVHRSNVQLTAGLDSAAANNGFASRNGLILGGKFGDQAYSQSNTRPEHLPDSPTPQSLDKSDPTWDALAELYLDLT